MYQGSALHVVADLARPPAGVRRTRGATCAVYLGRSLAASSPEPVGTPIVAVDDRGRRPSSREAEWATRCTGSPPCSTIAMPACSSRRSHCSNWHASHRFSPRTGEPTLVEKGGWVRRDPVSDTEIFPRTDPAVIVGVHRRAGSSAARLERPVGVRTGTRCSRASSSRGSRSRPPSCARSSRSRACASSTPCTSAVSRGRSRPRSWWVSPRASIPAFTGAATPDGTEIIDLRWFSRDELAGVAGSRSCCPVTRRSPAPSSRSGSAATIDDGER